MTTNPTRVVELKINGSWVDVSSWVDVGPGGAAIVITRGRENEQADTQPGSCTFSLVNDDGRFSFDLPAGAYYPHFKKWIEARVTVKGKRRFTGYMSDVETTLDDETGLHSHSAITCTDALGIQAASPAAASWASKLIGDLSPLYWWPMTEPEGSSAALEANGGPSLVPTLLSGTASLSDLVKFGITGSDALETDTLVHVESVFNSSGAMTSHAALVAAATMSGLATLTSGITILCLYFGEGSDSGDLPQTADSPLFEMQLGTSVLQAFTTNGATQSSVMIVETGPVTGIGGNSIPNLGFNGGNAGLVAITVDTNTIQLLGAGGNPFGTISRPTVHRPSYIGATLRVGGGGATGRTNVGQFAILNGKMSEATFANLAAKISGAGTSALSDWLKRALDVAGVTQTLSVTTDRQMHRPTLKGSNPAAIGNTLAKACGGAYLAARDSTPKWLDPTYCPAWVEIPFDHIDPGVSRAPDQNLTYTEISVDGTPTASTGGWPKSELDIPGLLPDADLAHYVRWLTNSADVWAEGRYSELTIDLQPLDSATTDTYLELDVRSRVLPTSVPAQFPDGQVLTVEGLSEYITADTWKLTLNTAPDPRFVLGDAVAGVLGSNYRLFWT